MEREGGGSEGLYTLPVTPHLTRPPFPSFLQVEAMHRQQQEHKEAAINAAREKKKLLAAFASKTKELKLTGMWPVPPTLPPSPPSEAPFAPSSKSNSTLPPPTHAGALRHTPVTTRHAVARAPAVQSGAHDIEVKARNARRFLAKGLMVDVKFTGPKRGDPGTGVAQNAKLVRTTAPCCWLCRFDTQLIGDRSPSAPSCCCSPAGA